MTTEPLTIGISQARRELSSLIHVVRLRPVIITAAGHPVAQLTPAPTPDRLPAGVAERIADELAAGGALDEC